MSAPLSPTATAALLTLLSARKARGMDAFTSTKDLAEYGDPISGATLTALERKNLVARRSDWSDQWDASKAWRLTPKGAVRARSAARGE